MVLGQGRTPKDLERGESCSPAVTGEEHWGGQLTLEEEPDGEGKEGANDPNAFLRERGTNTPRPPAGRTITRALGQRGAYPRGFIGFSVWPGGSGKAVAWAGIGARINAGGASSHCTLSRPAPLPPFISIIIADSAFCAL